MLLHFVFLLINLPSTVDLEKSGFVPCVRRSDCCDSVVVTLHVYTSWASYHITLYSRFSFLFGLLHGYLTLDQWFVTMSDYTLQSCLSACSAHLLRYLCFSLSYSHDCVNKSDRLTSKSCLRSALKANSLSFAPCDHTVAI